MVIYLCFKYIFPYKNILIDTHTKITTEITDIVVFRKKLLKFLQGVNAKLQNLEGAGEWQGELAGDSAGVSRGCHGKNCLWGSKQFGVATILESCQTVLLGRQGRHIRYTTDTISYTMHFFKDTR